MLSSSDNINIKRIITFLVVARETLDTRVPARTEVCLKSGGSTFYLNPDREFVLGERFPTTVLYIGIIPLAE